MDKNELYNEFLERFPIEKLKNMTLEDYALGTANEDSFCAWLEFKTKELGNMSGGTSYAHGIFKFNKNGKNSDKIKSGQQKDDDYAWSFKYGNDRNSAFETIRNIVCQIAENAQNGNYAEIDKIDFSPIAKMKIAFMYSNKRMLNIFKKEAIEILANRHEIVNTLSIPEKSAELVKKCVGEDYWTDTHTLWQEWQENHTIHYWLYQPGEGARLWDELYNADIIAIGWDELGDLREYKSRQAISKAIKEIYSKDNEPRNDSKCLWEFYKEMNEGDVVYVKSGLYEFIGRGIVEDKYLFDDTRQEYNNTRKIQWTHKGNWTLTPDILKKWNISGLPQKTLTEIGKYTNWYKEFDSIFNGNYKSKIEMESYINLLQTKKNLILQGAPGTGKTYTTASIAVAMCNKNFSDFADHKKVMKEYENLRKSGQIEFCTFHQSMDYEDFVEGLKPEVKGNTVEYNVVDGIFKRICKSANRQNSNVQDNFEDAWLLLIDFLNDNDCKDVSLISNSAKTFRIELNENGDGLANRTYIDDNFKKGEWVRGQSKFFSKDQLYNVYRGMKGIPSGGHDNYRKAIVECMKKDFGLKEYSQGIPLVEDKNHILIIDEINRGNISKIFGELITLLEADKRIGDDTTHPITVRLPYSKEEFAVPSNLYIIGTMNTTDRSTGTIDYAVRRRFAFVTLKADENLVPDFAKRYFENVKNFISDEKHKLEDFDYDDLMVGHSYFMAKDEEELKLKIKHEVFPLICEYVKDGILRCSKEDLEQLKNDLNCAN